MGWMGSKEPFHLIVPGEVGIDSACDQRASIKCDHMIMTRLRQKTTFTLRALKHQSDRAVRRALHALRYLSSPSGPKSLFLFGCLTSMIKGAFIEARLLQIRVAVSFIL